MERLLLERISLRGICRAVGVGLRWLLQFIGDLLEALFLPRHQDEIMAASRKAAAQRIANASGRSSNQGSVRHASSPFTFYGSFFMSLKCHWECL
jgi:hypothetical protein